MDRLEGLDESGAAPDVAGQFIASILLASRKKVRDPQQSLAILLHRAEHPDVRESNHRKRRERTKELRGASGVQVGQNSNHARAGGIEPRSQAGVAAVKVRELVSQDGSELRDRERSQKGQTKNSPASPGFGDESIGGKDEVNLSRHGLRQSRRDGFDFRRQLRVFDQIQQNARRLEFLWAGNGGPQNGDAGDRSKQEQQNTPQWASLQNPKRQNEAEDADQQIEKI